jgi:hypothetical protein
MSATVLLHRIDGGFERVNVPKGIKVAGDRLPYVSRRVISSLAHALILPPTGIGYTGNQTHVPEGRTTGSVGAPSAWLFQGHLISPQMYREGMNMLTADDRYHINGWLGRAKQQYTVGDDDALAFVRERLPTMGWDEIREEALQNGGLKRSWRTDPLFRSHVVLPDGLAFWRLAISLGMAEQDNS